MSKLAETHVLCVAIEPRNYNPKGGLSTSTRNRALELGNFKRDVKTAKLLFYSENFKVEPYKISGSQDSIGCVLPGLKHLVYNGNYWPSKIEIIRDPNTLEGLENHIGLVYTHDKPEDFNVFKNRKITEKGVKEYSRLVLKCLDAIRGRNSKELGKYMTKSFDVLCEMMPSCRGNVDYKKFSNLHGYKLAGSGGGGYLITVAKNPFGERIKIK
jgi:galactokinase/mevalonate kinase-like predicted kinase